MGVLLVTIFVASLLGSLHCVGMCGPFALLAASTTENPRPSVAPTIAYSGGRLLSYSVIGVLFGLLGMALNQGTAFATWQQTATYVAGGLMILVGGIALARQAGLRIRLPQFARPLQQLVKAGFRRTQSLPPQGRACAIGALTSLMPCGWLYTFAITAAGTGSPAWGAGVMVAFWAGTVPIMVALTLGFDRLGVSIQKRVPLMMACLVILIGVFTIAWRAPVSMAGAPDITVATDVDQLTDNVLAIDHETLPCCCANKEQPDDQ